MKRLSFAFLVLAFRSMGFGQASPEIPPTSTTPKIDDTVAVVSPPPATAPTTADAPARPRATSADTAAKINATIPKFSPPKNTEAKAPAESPDLRETDKPRNGIIRLPKHIVQEQRDPVFKEREVLTPQGKLDLAYKRHPGLRFGSLPFLSNNGIALFMLEEEQRLERKAEKEELESLYLYSDPKAGAALKRETSDTFIRHAGPRNQHEP